MDKDEGEISSDCCGENQSDGSELKIRVIKRRRTDKDETPFEAFKRTPKYKAILKKMGKLKDEDLQNDSEDELKLNPKAAVDETTRDMKRLKIYPYEDYIKHMRTGNCHRLRSFQCPLKCCEERMSYGGLLSHLKKDCPMIEIKCNRCGFKEIRSRWKRH
jgi:hypothetical protein